MEELVKQLIEGQNQLIQSNKKITTEISNIKLDLARMEQENSRKIGLLIDGWQEHEEKFDAMGNQLNGITETLGRIELNMLKFTAAQTKQSYILETLSVRSVEHEAELRSLKIAK